MARPHRGKAGFSHSLLFSLSILQAITAQQYDAQFQPCPISCTLPLQPLEWTPFSSVWDLQYCNLPMLLSFDYQNCLIDGNVTTTIYACTEGNGVYGNYYSPNATTTASAASTASTGPATTSTMPSTAANSSGVCDISTLPNAWTHQTTLTIQEGNDTCEAAVTIAKDTWNTLSNILQGYLQDPKNCNNASLIAYNLGMAAAIYTGPFADLSSGLNALQVVNQFLPNISQGTTNLLAQTCDPDRNALNMVGVAVAQSGPFALYHMQQSLLAWAAGYCFDVPSWIGTYSEVTSIQVLEAAYNVDGVSDDSTDISQSASLVSSTSSSQLSSTAGSHTSSTSTSHTSSSITHTTSTSTSSSAHTTTSSKPTSTASKNARDLEEYDLGSALIPRSTCKTTKVKSGDGCYNVAQRCGISQSQLASYNGGSNFCSTLQPGQTVCCSSGTLPSNGPPPNSDGSCASERVQAGDSCGALASRCHITPNQFMQYNTQPNLCSTLQVDQRVCCSSGKLANIAPSKNPDGSCASYIVKANDTCDGIALTYGITVPNLQSYNHGTTWGWSGCKNLQMGNKICLSSGTPPFPKAVAGTTCGPLVPGTSPGNTPASQWASLNPCPLNACCDQYGFCGTTPQFCANNSTGPTGNPGTAPPNTTVCISNCGTNIVTASPNNNPMSVGYYEAWNPSRACLNWDINDIGILRQYSHVHWAFATIDASSFNVVLNDTYDQWDAFLGVTSFKRIISFGGWGFSTDPSTYNVLRAAMQPANVGTFVNNIVNFVQSNGLDGVDFDWEYPGAPDIPGIPPGLKSDGPNYLVFLQKLRSALGNKYTMSIAAPASYWYLRGFPIANMAKVLDYIVYMTYDLHGQWDYGNKWSQEQCPGGNCLRSHVNLTETNYALAMITKAGVPTNKIAVGVGSYGRSFGMTNPSCTGPLCTYQGPDSTARPGKCTKVAGYISNAELESIMYASNLSSKYDGSSDSDTLVYGGKTWVSFMTNHTIKTRTSYYESMGFAGVAEWAIDLSTFTPDNGQDNSIHPTPGKPGTTEDSLGYPFGDRDRRSVCSSEQVQDYQANFNRDYQTCYNPTAQGWQPTANGNSLCVKQGINDGELCNGAGCTLYGIHMDQQFDTDQCQYYQDRLDKYLTGLVLKSTCKNYWTCTTGGLLGNIIGFALQISVGNQDAHVDSMMNDLFTLEEESNCAG